MNSPETSARRVAVIGGGISGLATAHRLVELDPRVSIALFEREDRMGGVLETKHHDGFLLEWGADNFITNVPWAVDLCRRIGFEDQLLETDEQHRGAFVVRKGKLRRIPQGFIIMAPSRVWPVVATPILSPWGKLRMAAEVLRASAARRVRRKPRGLRHPAIRPGNVRPARATADRRHLYGRSEQAESASDHAPVP